MAVHAEGVSPADSLAVPPVVDRAYVPSGRTTIVAVGLMALVAAMVGPIAGAVVFMGDQLVSAIGGLFAPGTPYQVVIVLVFSVVAYVGGGLVLGGLIGKLIGRVGVATKNRNAWLSALAAVGAVVATLLAFYGIRKGEMGSEAFDSFIDWLKLGLYGAGGLVAAPTAAWGRVLDAPFCEDCFQRMDSIRVVAVPAESEQDVLKTLQGTHPERIRGFPIEPDPERNHTAVELFYCRGCENSGLLEARTEIQAEVETPDGSAATRDSRLVFSTLVSREVIVPMLQSSAAVEPISAPRLEIAADPVRPVSTDADSIQEPVAMQPIAATSIGRLSCFTCGNRLADMTSVQGLNRTDEFNRSHEARWLKETGYLRSDGVLVPRCRECFDAERAMALGGQAAAWLGIPSGIAAGVGITIASGVGLLGGIAGFVVFVAIATLIMRRARGVGPSDANSIEASEHPAVHLAVGAGAKMAGWILPREGLSPDVLRKDLTLTKMASD